jgi:hypothetical protein
MLTEPVGDQPAFLVVETVLLVAGLVSIGLGIVERWPDHTHGGQ